jgi:hypothetical protein
MKGNQGLNNDEKRRRDLRRSESKPNEDERSLDIGESGQFAPGGYYNQQGVTQPRRIDLDDDILPPARESRITRN